MSNWSKPIRALIRVLPGSAVRTLERELQEAQADLLSVQAELARSAGRLKGLKAQPNADPKELGSMEGRVAIYSRQLIAARRRIAELEQHLDLLDPDRSPHRSAPQRTSP